MQRTHVRIIGALIHINSFLHSLETLKGKRMGKKNNSSKGPVRRSERLAMQIPRTRFGKKKKQTRSSMARLEEVMKILSPRSRLSGKSSTGKRGKKKVKSHSTPDVNEEKKFKNLNELYAETKHNGASKQEKVKTSLGVGTKRKTRVVDREDMEMIQPSKKKVKVSDSSKKTMQTSPDVRVENGSKNDEKVQREDGDGAELKDLEIEHCERTVGLEEQEQVPHISETSPSNRLCDDYHQERDASGGMLNTEPRDFYTSDVTTIQQEANTEGIPEAYTEGIPVEASTSTTSNTFSAHVNAPNALQLPTFTTSEMPSLSSYNALEYELERTQREINRIVNIHEETKSRLKSERDKKIEEIRKKYDAKVKEANASYLSKTSELDVVHNKVMMHKFLAEAMEFKCFNTEAVSEIPQVIPSRLTNPLSGSLPHSIVPGVQAVRPSVPVSNPTPGFLHTDTIPLTAPHKPVRTYTHSHRLESFGSASLPVPSSHTGSVSSDSSSEQARIPPTGAHCARSSPLQLPQDPAHSFRTSNSRFHSHPMDSLMGIGRRNHSDHANNVARVVNTVQTSESLDVSALTSNVDIANNVALSPNEMQILGSSHASALQLP